jgi:DNA-binding CsgD family transcriptional regulator/tetratricopeptide (TPR) repeat protein
MATRMTSARFVGRAGQLAELEAALRDAADGRPSLALVAGESGVGKSRLVQELVGAAHADGVFVLSGDCVELGEGELPYAPLVSALRPLLRDGHPAFDALPTALQGALGEIMPGLDEATGDGDASQASVFEALLTLLERLGGERAVLLVIEDLHWADSSTRGFLSFLSRTICRERMMLVGTYRSDELHRRHPLRPLLGELARDPAARMLDLPPFTRDELAEQLEGILAGTPEPGLVERVWTRSEGNALFTEEILAAGLDGRGPLPPTLRDALMLRVELLSPAAQEVLRWLACQTATDHELLAAVSACEPDELRDALREAVAAHILVATAEEGYAFRHALLREVVHDDLLPGERTELHSVLARALEERIAAGDAGAHITAQVAHHWMAAGDQPQALAAAVRAAGAAERVDAYAEAHALLERALGLWDQLDDPEALVGATRGELLLRAAHAADVSGEGARFEALLRGALELVDPAREPRRVAGLLWRLHRVQWDLNRQDESIETLDRALAVLGPGEPTGELAALLAAKARARMLQSRYREAIEAGREALEVARSVGDAAAEAQALNAIGVALAAAREVDEGIATLREARTLARERDLLDHIQRTSHNLADTLHLAGRSDEALTVAREARTEALGRDREVTWLTLLVAEIEFDTGDWRAAEAAMPDRRRRYWGTTLIDYRLRRIEQALGRGDDAEARVDLDATARVAADSTEPQFLAPLGAHRAELERRAGDVDAARSAVDDALDRIEFCSDDLARIAMVALAGVRVEADEAQRARDRRDDSAERAALDRASAMADRVSVAAESGAPVVLAQRAFSEAELARAQGRNDPALWEAAAAASEEIGRPYPAAYARWRATEALATGRDREGAERTAAAALETARRLGSVWLVDEVEGLAARARLRVEGVEPPEQPVDGDADADPFGLTAREGEVLALVAAGATNREIGERLHMAEKTASVHVSRILAKLDVRSRTEAAAVAHRHGLAGTSPVA